MDEEKKGNKGEVEGQETADDAMDEDRPFEGLKDFVRMAGTASTPRRTAVEVGPAEDLGGGRRLTREEIEDLSPEQFDALPLDVMQRYFQLLDWENQPSATELFIEEFLDDEDDVDPDEFLLGDESTDGGESCESAAMREPAREERPEGQEPPAGPGEEGPFGELIFAYTRERAIEDGVLVDVSETAKEAGFRIPVALTRAVWAEYVAVPEGVEGQDEAGRLWDVLWMGRYGISRGNRDRSEIRFQLHVRNDNREGEPPLVTLKAVVGPDDHGAPCLTIMLPDED
jgi:hypothetical protein